MIESVIDDAELIGESIINGVKIYTYKPKYDNKTRNIDKEKDDFYTFLADIIIKNEQNKLELK